MNYRHTQIGTLTIVVFVLFLIGALTFLQNGATRPGGQVALIVLIIALMLFYSLTVEIRDEQLHVWFGPGLIRRSISLDEIAAARAVRNPWYAGWGIRWMPGSYWLWNVSGFEAVELEFKNGKRFRIGTDEPEELVKAIQNTR
jgi:hypothetical protein